MAPRAHGAPQAVALASISLRGAKSDLREREALLSVLHKVRLKPMLRDCQVIMIIECCMGIAASHISRYVEGEPNVTVMFEGAGGKEGVPKSNESTEIMKSEFEALLEQNLFRFAPDLVTYGDTSSQRERDRFFAQLANLRYEALKRANPYDDQRYKITAKSGSTPDDLLVSVMMCPYWKRRFWSSPNPLYEPAKERIRARFGYE